MPGLDEASTTELLDELGVRISKLDLLDHPAGADIEILDALAVDPPCLKPSLVRVNGVDVGLIAKGGITLDVGDARSPATVTLTLFPKSVTLKAGTV